MHFLLLFAASLVCPVLDTATVVGAIGEVKLSVTHAEKIAGFTCLFTRVDHDLTVEVTTLPAPSLFARLAENACQGAHETAPLKAIGNQAIACSLGSDHRIAEKIVSRVRNRAFTVSLTTTDEAADAKSIRSKLTALAEQIAGNLF